jgi:cell division protein FtsZ
LRAVENALNSPLLNDNNIKGARHVLLNIMSGSDDITMDEFGEITDYLQEESGYTAELITGYGIDPSLGDQVSVTIIATGFKARDTGFESAKETERVISVLTEETPVSNQTVVVQKLVEPEIKKAEEPFIIKKNDAEQNQKETKVAEENIHAFSSQNSSDEIVLKKVESIESTENNIETTVQSIEEKNDADFVITTVAEINPPVISETETIDEEIKSEVKQSKFNENVNMFINEGITSDNLEELEREDKIRIAQERIKRLKELSLKIKTPEGLSQMEKEPTFKRKNTQLDDTNFSTESNVSRYTLSEGDGKTEIKPNNSFLHDNVD